MDLFMKHLEFQEKKEKKRSKEARRDAHTLGETNSSQGGKNFEEEKPASLFFFFFFFFFKCACMMSVSPLSLSLRPMHVNKRDFQVFFLFLSTVFSSFFSVSFFKKESFSKVQEEFSLVCRLTHRSISLSLSL